MKKITLLIVLGVLFCVSTINVLAESDDSTPPVITILGDNPKYLELGDLLDDEGATAFDETDGDLSDKVNAVTNFDHTAYGKYFVKYDVCDNSNNCATEKRIVYVQRPSQVSLVEFSAKNENNWNSAIVYIVIFIFISLLILVTRRKRNV